ncbi:glycosyl transferase family 4 [Methanococcoides sp. SA1]|nr:glycosyl transferase family 4 [Methanococcoides sp. SA1]
MNPIILVAILISFLVTLISLPHWIRKCKQFGLVGRDIHKVKKVEVAEGGGLMVLLGVVFGILVYVAFQTFYIGSEENVIEVFALLCVLFIAGGLGIIDDLLGWKKGLSRKVRIVIMIFAAIPLMVINAGESSVLGIELGIFFPLLVIPFAVMVVTTTFNFLAGYNGLEASQGILLLLAVGITTYLTGNTYLSVIAAIGIASLIAFLKFNFVPAKVLGGDALTYSIGALFVGIVILGNIEKIGMFFFIPYILETGLKLRGKLVKESFGKLKKDGSLDMPYSKIYGLEHLAIFVLGKIKSSGKVYERDVVLLINAFQGLVIVLGFWLFL